MTVTCQCHSSATMRKETKIVSWRFDMILKTASFSWAKWARQHECTECSRTESSWLTIWKPTWNLGTLPDMESLGKCSLHSIWQEEIHDGIVRLKVNSQLITNATDFGGECIEFWNKKGHWFEYLDAHIDWVNLVAFSPADDSQSVSASHDGMMKV
jgi:WD40 repeat protein